MLKGKHVVLAVTGGIAAYKMATMASLLVKQHADVQVLMTQNATNFITPSPSRPSPATNVWWIRLTGTLSSMWSMCRWRSRRTLLW